MPAEQAGFNVITVPDDFFEKKTSPTIVRLSLPGNEQVYGIGKDKTGAIWISSYRIKYIALIRSITLFYYLPITGFSIPPMKLKMVEYGSPAIFFYGMVQRDPII